MIPGNIESTEVVIPARGITPWLSLSLSSIASQNLQPAGVIIVDDGLENGRAIEDLGRKLFGERFRLFKNAGRGISAALNTGIQQSSARWIVRMDADDVAHSNRLRQQIGFLIAAPKDVLGCGTQVRFINPEGRVLGYSHLPSSWEETSEQMLRKTCFVHSTLVFRREALLTTPYRSTMDGAEDVDLVLRLSEKGKIANLNQVLLDYRLHPTQESFRSRARHTAVQELAFRLALSRRQKNMDPLKGNPELAEKFIRWRLSTPGYVRSRTFLTTLRYMQIHLSGFDLKGFARCAAVGLSSLPLSPSSLYVAWRVYRKAGAALLHRPTPFEPLNVN
jgi:glycosyltransferase involved in cell wall biosynthesis